MKYERRKVLAIMKGRCKKMSLKQDVSKNLKCVRISPNQCTRRKIMFILQHRQETSFYICQRGSLTLEAAVIIPLTIGFFITILFFFRVLFIQAAVEQALVYTGRVVAVESALTDSEEVLYVSAEALFKQKLLQDENVNRYVVGNVLGISLLGSNMSQKEIQLTANYLVRFPISLFGKRGLWMTSKNSFVKWKGDLYVGVDQGEWVYITETGSVYHKDTSCRSLDLHIRDGLRKNIDSYRGKNGQKYAPCGRCLEEGKNYIVVYFTDYGKLYHGDLSCSALKRTIIKVLLSEVGDKRACSFCYK